MKKRIIITTVVLAAIHLVMVIGSVIIAIGSGMEAFDDPDYQPSMVERVAGRLAGILLQPGRSLWTPWVSRNMPDAIEWMLVVLNSLLWGIVLAVVLNSPAVLKRKVP